MNAAVSSLGTFEFAQPAWLVLLLVLVPLWRRRSEPGRLPAVTFSSVRLLGGLGRPVSAVPRRAALWLRLLAVTLIVLALARPRVERAFDEEKTEGIDILLVVDASRSMDSGDFDYDGRKISRREALQRVLGEFVKERPRDRIGMLGFAEKPFLISPLTVDHSWLIEAMENVKTSLGTAIGSGVEAAVDLLRRGDSPSKIIIVVTDGLNTSGVDPLASARTARRFGIRLYTIGVVSYAEMKTGGLDALTLNQMARLTGGQFFQAADGSALRAIYRQIDSLERHESKQAKLRAYRELFPWPATVALGLLAAEIALISGKRRSRP